MPFDWSKADVQIETAWGRLALLSKGTGEPPLDATMSDETHSPGPWRVLDEPGADGADIQAADGSHVTCCRTRDARIISAAPETAAEHAEMLALLREINQCEKDAEEVGDRSPIAGTTIAALRALLARIDGKGPAVNGNCAGCGKPWSAHDVPLTGVHLRAYERLGIDGKAPR